MKFTQTELDYDLFIRHVLRYMRNYSVSWIVAISKHRGMYYGNS